MTLVLIANNPTSLDTSAPIAGTQFPILFKGATTVTAKGLTPVSKGALPLLVNH